MKKVTLLIPTLNEIDGMRVIMPRIDRSWVSQIIIADGGSTDGTVEYAREHGYQVAETKELGIRFGYRAALPLIEGDAIILFSPDGNSIPEAIPKLIAKYEEGYDLVIASRYLGGVKSEDDSLLTAFGNWFFTKSVNFLMGANYTDVLVQYRIFSKHLIEDLELEDDRWHRTSERLFRCRLGWENMISYRVAIRKLKIAEVPVDEPRRIGGVRMMQPFSWGAAGYFQLVRDDLFFR